MINDSRFLSLKKFFTRFVGIGERQAKRFVYELLEMDKNYIKETADAMISIVDDIKKCERCGIFCNYKESKKCPICNDTTRNSKVVMVVEKDSDVYAIENSNEYKGLYIVLGSLFSIANANSESLNKFQFKIKEIAGDGLQEIILAFSTTPNGEHTADVIQQIISKQFPDLKVSVLGRGLSSGAELEYSDAKTILHAIKGRNPLGKKN